MTRRRIDRQSGHRDLLKLRRAWVIQFKALARIGALEQHLAEEKAQPTGWHNALRYHTEMGLDILYKMITECDTSPKMLRMLVGGIYRGAYITSTPDPVTTILRIIRKRDVYAALLSRYTRASMERHYGPN